MKDIDFLVDFVAGNAKKFQKLCLKGKINWVLNVFTLPNFESFNYENVKNKNVFTDGLTT